MGTFRRLAPEVLETLGLEPEGDEDEPDEPSGPYELPHRAAELFAARGGGLAMPSATGARLRAAPSGAYGSIVRQRYVRTSPTIDPFVRCLERTPPRQRMG